MKLKVYYEFWQNGLILGTICLGLGLLRLVDPFPALPHSTLLCFVGCGVGYTASFISFRRFDKQQNYTGVKQ